MKNILLFAYITPVYYKMKVCSALLLFVITIARVNNVSKATISDPKARVFEAGYQKTDSVPTYREAVAPDQGNV